jgi:hypothetical protein
VLCDISIQLSMAVYDHIHLVDNSSDSCSLWAVVICQLETGEVELKTVSLSFVQMLMQLVSLMVTGEVLLLLEEHFVGVMGFELLVIILFPSTALAN